MEQNKTLTVLRVPSVPVWSLLVAALVLLVYSIPSLDDLLIFDRTAIIGGEYWRLITGNLVHYSRIHLVYNLLAWLIVSSIIWQRGYRYFHELTIFSGAVVGISVFIFRPEVEIYAGLSGTVSSAVTYLCLHGMRERGTWRLICSFIFAGLLIKTLIELYWGLSWSSMIHKQDFTTEPLSHAAGILSSVMIFSAVYFGRILHVSKTS